MRLPALAKCDRDIDLFDVHVEQIAQQHDVVELLFIEPTCSINHAVELVGLVAVERLVDQRHAVLLRVVRTSSCSASLRAAWASSFETPSPLRPCIEPMIAGAPNRPGEVE